MTSRSRAARILSVSLLFALALPAANPQTKETTQSPKARAMGRKLHEKGVPNFGEVTPMLYRGGQPSPKGFERLAQMGIGIVVDTGRSKRDEKQIVRLGMRYVSLPWYCPFPKEKAFAKFLQLIRDNPDKKIFVHCRLGDDRTGMMIAAYRMGLQGWTAGEAMKEMHLFGYTAVHHLMCPGLAGYEESFPERFRKDPEYRELR